LPAIAYRPLRRDTRCDKFVCGDAEIDKWFRKHAYRDHCESKHVVTCAYIEGHEEDVVGFYALSSVIEDAKKLPEVKFFPFGGTAYFPCIQIVYIGVQKDFQRQPDLRVGSIILGHIVKQFAELGTLIGMPALIVTPMNAQVANFYGRIGFAHYDNNTRMVLPLRLAVETVEQARAEA
jgi:ribosomal protein S18 acetylase RimI-like enzyme